MKGIWIQEPSNNIVIIFVHGILSEDATCWTHANGTYWPSLLTQNRVYERFGIYSFEYKTGFFSGNYDLNDVVDALREQLKLDKVTECKTLIFVCHSMGGIIARKYIVQNAADLEREEKRIGLFLIASPSLGAKYANWLKPLAKMFKHSQASALRFTQDNIWLNGLDRDFINIKESGHLEIRGKELVEDIFVIVPRFFLMKQVVEPISGAKYFGNAIKIPDSDHFSIAKVENVMDTKNRLLAEFLNHYRSNLHKQSLQEKTVIGLSFTDDLHADLVSCQLQIENLANGDLDVEVNWPDATLNIVKQLEDLLDEVPKYLQSESLFYGEDPRELADMASSIKNTLTNVQRMKDGVRGRAPLLVKGMLPYWTIGLDNVIARALANFLTLVNYQILRQSLYYFRHVNLYKDFFPKQYESWFQADKSVDSYSQIFPIIEEICSVKISAISGVGIPTGAWFWGPRSEVLNSAKWRPGEPIQGTWFDKLLIPQNELRLCIDASDKIYPYDEIITTIKVLDSDNNEIY